MKTRKWGSAWKQTMQQLEWILKIKYPDQCHNISATTFISLAQDISRL